jgi:DNA topoisomerase-3
LTEEAIQEGFKSLKDAQDYDNLYAAGSSRAIGDWLLGINATRAFTVKYGQKKITLSIGRVQTPTLAMIVQRQKEINAFISNEYWELKTIYRETEFLCQIDRLNSEVKAQKGVEYLKTHPFEVTSFEQKEGKEGNPRLFDLTGLQVEANRKIGFSADETLKLVQSLYEKKLVTYPRVDTTYLSEDLYPKIPNILRGLKYYSKLTAPLLEKSIPKSKAVFDDKKVTDHHAIIPTGIVPSGITPQENQIYDLIAKRFIAVFYPECKIATTTVLAKVDKLEFKATGKQILEPGWRSVYANDKNIENPSETKKEEDRVLPVFEEGETGPHEPFFHKGKTSAPKPYTEATLLRAMETAGKQVEDDEMREMMKDNGIGRPSTRANIIETLFRRKYIEKVKKNIYATQTGIDLIDTIDSELLKSPELTGQWEKKLRLIEKGDYLPEQFKHELFTMVREVTDGVIFSNQKRIDVNTVSALPKKVPTEKQIKPKKEAIDITTMACPKCKNAPIIVGKSAIGCTNYAVCGFKIPFHLMGKKLTDNQLKDLISKRKTTTIKGLINPGTNETIQGRLILDASWNVALEKI